MEGGTLKAKGLCRRRNKSPTPKVWPGGACFTGRTDPSWGEKPATERFRPQGARHPHLQSFSK